jgi:anti-sigma regulatory factor (Ser/Thr protein kinase)
MTTALPANLPAIRGDATALERVLSNLIDNAIKYCPEGAAIVVAAEDVGGKLRVTVSDDGPGIEARHLPRLFERFYRCDPGRSRAMGGTGLGLSIVKHLVEAMGGTVQVKSTPGQGAKFSFTVRTVGSGTGRRLRSKREARSVQRLHDVEQTEHAKATQIEQAAVGPTLAVGGVRVHVGEGRCWCACAAGRRIAQPARPARASSGPENQAARTPGRPRRGENRSARRTPLETGVV